MWVYGKTIAGSYQIESIGKADIFRNETVEILSDLNTVCDGQAHESLLLSVKDLNILTEMTRLLHRFQGLCMAHTTLYIQKNAYYIQIFNVCNCIIIFQP